VDRDQLKAHLQFAADLGVAGVSRDAAWRTRPGGPTHGSAPTTDDVDAGRRAGAEADPRAPTTDDLDARVGVGADPRVRPVITTDVAADPRVHPGPAAFFKNSADALVAVRTEIGDCTRCKLHALGRRQIVFGVGNADADLMFVGEAPGADEDVQGIPFVGRAGQLLTKIIEAIGLQRDEVYIANVIKCRPPGNRNPEQDEVETCEPFLFQQIDIIKPKVIVALGKFGAQTLLRTLDPISRLRGRVYNFRGAKLIPTFHPAYLLRNPSSKREVWDDMKLVRKLLREDSSP
jgi:uracil-DNA glycosylase family 4